MIDSHCHLSGAEFDADRAEVVARAAAAGVDTVLAVACHPDDFGGLHAFLDAYPRFYGALGFHPEAAALCPSAKDLSAYFSRLQLVAVGETGLDYYYQPETATLQQTAFQRHIEAAYHLKKPLIIHTREAEADTIALLQEAERGGLLSHGGVLHCFTGSRRLAEEALKLGFFLSASGVITFRNAEGLRETFRLVPPDRLLVETDAPYLAPVPYRGRRNEPAFVMQTAAFLAELKGLSADEFEKQISYNFNRLFLKGKVKHED